MNINSNLIDVQICDHFSAPGTGPVTSNNIFGFRTDILLQLLNIKARRAYPGTQNISEIVPMLLKHLYETMEKNDTSVRSVEIFY